jgi:hypothetical protein
MKLFLSGTTDFSVKKPSLVLVNLKKFLDASKDGELFTTAQLSEKLKFNIGTLRNLDKVQALPEYSHLVARQRYWGKPSAIRQLIKETK